MAGISWMEAVFQHNQAAQLVRCRAGARADRRRAASIPGGVAALPSPSRLAQMLALERSGKPCVLPGAGKEPVQQRP